MYPSVLQFLGLAFQDQAWCSASALLNEDLLLPVLIQAVPREMCSTAPPGGASGGQRGAAGPLPAPRPQQPLVLGMPPPFSFFFFSISRAKECSKTFSNRYFLSDLIYRVLRLFCVCPCFLASWQAFLSYFIFMILFFLCTWPRGVHEVPAQPSRSQMGSFLFLSPARYQWEWGGGLCCFFKIKALISPDCFSDKNQ